MNEKKEVIVLVMSVGKYETNYTAKYFNKIGGKEHIVICLPKQFEENAESYTKNGINTYIYDEKKYINKDFEFFGFNPRNCGGIGRQGIAEAVEKLGDENTIFFQVDDDTSSFNIKKLENGKFKSIAISKWSNFKKFVIAEDDFYNETGIECMAQTGATPPEAGKFIGNHKIFNNFIMRKGNRLNFDGFKALCSDDQRFNIYHNLLDNVPMITHQYMNITFHQNQGDREDGNAVLYNTDFSWKKSFSLRMIMPQGIAQKISKETNRILFRENISASKLYPPIYLCDKNGNIVGEAK